MDLRQKKRDDKKQLDKFREVAKNKMSMDYIEQPKEDDEEADTSTDPNYHAGTFIGVGKKKLDVMGLSR